MKIITLDEKEFDSYALTHKYRSYYQSSAYGKTMANFGYNVHYLGIVDDTNKIIGATLILYKEVFMNNKYAYAPRGVLFDYGNSFIVKEFADKIKALLGKQGFMYLKMDPYIPASIRDKDGNMLNINPDLNIIMANLKNADFTFKGKNLYFENEKARWEALCLLNVGADKLFNSFDKKTRHNIRQALNYGIDIFEDDSKDITKLYEFVKNKHTKPSTYYEKIIENFKDNAKVYYAYLNTEKFVVNSKRMYELEIEKNDILNNQIQSAGFNEKEKRRKLLNKKMESDKLSNIYKTNLITATNLLKEFPRGIIIGGALEIIYDNAGYLIIEGFDKKYKHLNCNYLLKWKMINDAVDNGFKYFNMNAITGDFSAKNRYAGLNEMKLSYNCLITEYIGEFEIVLNSLSYNIYKSINKKK